MKADIEPRQAQALKSKRDWRLDPQRVVIQAFVAGAAILGAAGTVLGYCIGKGQH